MEIAGWVLAGAGVAALGGGIAFAVLAADAADAVENSPQDTPWVEVQPHLDDFELYQPLEIGLLAGGSALAVAGLVLLLVDLGDGEVETETVVPVVSADALGLGMVGRF